MPKDLNKHIEHRLKFVSVASAQLNRQRAATNRLILNQQATVQKISQVHLENLLILNQHATVQKTSHVVGGNELTIKQLAAAEVVKAELIQEFNDAGNHRLIVVISNKASLSEWRLPNDLAIVESMGITFCGSINRQLPCVFVISPAYCSRRKV